MRGALCRSCRDRIEKDGKQLDVVRGLLLETGKSVALFPGRLYIEISRSDEAVVIGSFAEAHDLQPGDSLPAIINGRRQILIIVGIVDEIECE